MEQTLEDLFFPLGLDEEIDQTEYVPAGWLWWGRLLQWQKVSSINYVFTKYNNFLGGYSVLAKKPSPPK